MTVTAKERAGLAGLAESAVREATITIGPEEVGMLRQAADQMRQGGRVRQWKEVLFVNARVMIFDVLFRVIKCDQQKATLEPVAKKERGVPWSMRVRAGEPFLLTRCNEYLRITSVKIKNEFTFEGQILVAPVMDPSEKEIDKWQQTAFDIDDFEMVADEESD